MQKQPITFDQLPEYVYELGRKVDYLTTLLSIPSAPPDETGGIELARQVTRLSAARIYTLVSQRAIPHKKRGNRLTFRRSELLAWLDEGNRETKGGLPA
ncbi:helix-turn-helix domain-containing protein [Spirosoma taeanense]|uniref:Helix-turn-helix domain-containing protein n=1 Tax=Spirosoma taeanense TaxID=2735870 RepID=A0A6M5YBT7_9BACT|nr:helix-turn-helix domain-containing protein [Spirosoma taeanense]QJW90750.1 helix-turn-helix domain-containing protein [Spirosoma taeanense]